MVQSLAPYHLQFRLIVDSSVRVNGGLSPCVSPVIVWRPVQGAPTTWSMLAGIGYTVLADG